MSDLISRSELLKQLETEPKYSISVPKGFETLKDLITYHHEKVIEVIENIPTAYDVDKAVKELEDYLGDTNFEKSTKDVNESFYKGMSFAYGKAIEIVKQGSVSDDVCEWQKDGLFLRTSCNDIVRTWSDDFKYCPYCSKRVKIVDNDK